MNRALKVVLVLVLWALPALAQRRDPLTRVEADQIREASDDPAKRLGLIVKFARERMDSIEQLRADPKAEDRADKVHDLLADFQAIIDELDDNIDDYADRNADIRKPLKEVIEAVTDFQTKLKAMKDAATTDQRAASDLKTYSFLLQDTMEAVDSNLANAKKVLADQVANKGELKKSK